MSKTAMGRPELAAWLAEAGYEACGEQLAAVSTRQAPATAHRIADAIDGTLAEHDELLPEKLREFAYVTEAALEAPALYARLARAARAIRGQRGVRAMLSPEQDAEVSELLRDFDRVTARLFELGVNPYVRCTCVWSEPHAPSCPLAARFRP